MTEDNPIIVEPVSEPIRGQWMPVVGQETLDFLSAVVPEDSQDSVRDAAVSIISRSVPPTSQTGKETGLVVGYIQSGKTMSFETVAALAHDNAFQIVIVIAGIANPLLEQSTSRLRHDLRLDDRDRPRRWRLLSNPTADGATVSSVCHVLEGWRDPDTPKEYKTTILITVLKQHQRLQNLTDLICALDVERVPTLIIDDEADQASLNIEITQGQESTTYRCLMELRNVLPTHTYLQYTATPQAPLLVSIIDSLSPNFVQVLDPGDAYVGGREFFSGNSDYIREIPSQDVPTNANPLNEPPESLLDALRIFLLGVAVGIRHGNNTGNRSMLVHPSRQTVQHQEYYSWICDIVDEWNRTLALPDDEPDKKELIEDFRDPYIDLAQTVGGAFPSFDECVSDLRLAFRYTRPLEVNAREGHTPTVDWCSAYGWILVGGQAMDRGFTVEGLTVTYMPRGVGVGNADTIQQRARFFGYKRSYIGYCRIYLEQEMHYAFQQYVEHEEDIRTQLERFQESGQSLNDWKRAFVLDTGLKPCRHHVLKFDYVRGRFSNSWVTPKVIFTSNDIVKTNEKIVDEFVRNLNFCENDGHPNRTDVQRHYVCRDISLQMVIEQLLVGVRITGTVDSQRNTGLLLQLSKALEDNPDEICTIYRMSPKTSRSRTIDENGKIKELFQGEAPVDPPERRGEIYPGDRAIHDNDNVTVQIHILELMRDDQKICQNVPVLAVWIPERLGRAWITQEQQ